jgi:TIR domain-containing protein
LIVFLCHSSGDKERVRQLFHQLMADGVDCWFDEERILPGQYREYEIDRGISKSRFVLACRSKESVTKAGYVQKELKTALDAAAMQPEGIAFLIPVRLEECEVPHGMPRWQSVDLFKEGGYERLTLLCLSSGRQCCCRGVEDAEEFAGDVALQALDLAAGFALGSAACDVLPGCGAAPHAGQGDDVDRSVQGSVAAA